MNAHDFIKKYEAALATQDWSFVAPLISDDARVIFSDGSLYVGKEAIKTAYEQTFNTIKNEEYRVENVHWLAETSDSASYVFDFNWTGVINGRPSSGSGRGIAVIARSVNGWLLVGEQLGRTS